jgi:hypothetical protein
MFSVPSNHDFINISSYAIEFLFLSISYLRNVEGNGVTILTRKW